MYYLCSGWENFNGSDGKANCPPASSSGANVAYGHNSRVLTSSYKISGYYNMN